jgi:hypothetical protein
MFSRMMADFFWYILYISRLLNFFNVRIGYAAEK